MSFTVCLMKFRNLIPMRTKSITRRSTLVRVLLSWWMDGRETGRSATRHCYEPQRMSGDIRSLDWNSRNTRRHLRAEQRFLRVAKSDRGRSLMDRATLYVVFIALLRSVGFREQRRNETLRRSPVPTRLLEKSLTAMSGENSNTHRAHRLAFQVAFDAIRFELKDSLETPDSDPRQSTSLNEVFVFQRRKSGQRARQRFFDNGHKFQKS